jgi:transmembrane sensor
MNQNSAEHIWILMARKFSGEASAEELEELEQLLRTEPHINYSEEFLHDFWRSTPTVDSRYAETKYRNLVQQIKNLGADGGKFSDEDDHVITDEGSSGNNNKKKQVWRIGMAVFALICISVAGLIFYNDVPPNKNANNQLTANSEINTKSGSRTSLVLPDGTRVWLNASSTITYRKDYGNKLREVTLSGEAYFDVVKNKEKPFVIHTPKMEIKVLGTAFNVKCYPGEKTTETSLVRGSIEVTLKDRLEKIMLKPNEKLVINNQEDSVEKNNTVSSGKKAALKPTIEKPIITLTHLTLLPADNTIIETAWVQNRLLFSSETFEEVVLKMERWYNVKISIMNESLKEEHLTGNFEKETITEALKALQLTTKFSYTLKNNNINIYKVKSAND